LIGIKILIAGIQIKTIRKITRLEFLVQEGKIGISCPANIILSAGFQHSIREKEQAFLVLLADKNLSHVQRNLPGTGHPE